MPKPQINIAGFALLAFVVFLSSCQVDTTIPSMTIQAEVYIYQNTPIDHIKLQVAHRDGIISDAILEVSIVEENTGVVATAVPTTGRAGYYHLEDTSFLPQAGSTYRLRVGYDGQTASARTTIPNQIRSFKLDRNRSLDENLIYPANYSPTWINPIRELPIEDDRILVWNLLYFEWLNDTKAPYYFHLSHIQPEQPKPVPRDVPSDTAFYTSPFLDRVVNSDSMFLTYRDIEYFGKYQLIAFGVTDEYANLARQDQRDRNILNTSLSNIENGIGIFAGFSTDTIEICAVKYSDTTNWTGASCP